VKVAIMQPYLFPYIGYFQLIDAVDLFIVYDNIKYTKKGWINRNRLLQDGKDVLFSLPLKKDSDELDIRERTLAADYRADKLLNQFRGAYRGAPYFAQTFPLLEATLRHEDTNLFGCLDHALRGVCRHIGIGTEIRVSSTIDIDHGLRSQDKVIALCRAVGASTYINSIGGVDLYSKAAFAEHGIELQFLKPGPVEYPQHGAAFVPWLSIVDVLMFNPVDTVASPMLHRYELV
jgi:WbqC-like protein family